MIFEFRASLYRGGSVQYATRGPWIWTGMVLGADVVIAYFTGLTTQRTLTGAGM
jgi:hypothetical protein